jgi:hypothetical protein
MVIYGLIALVVIIIIGVTIGRTSRLKEETTENVSKKNPYTDMRNMAFAVSAEELGLQVSNDSSKIYAIIADLPMSSAMVTIVSYITGDTSIYLSSGGGFIGAGQHENIQKIVKKFIDFGQSYATKGEKFDTPELPTNGHANFYFRSNAE